MIAAIIPRLRSQRTAERILLLGLDHRVGHSSFQQLIARAHPEEVARLLLTVIPDRTYTLAKVADPAFAIVLGRLRNLFDLAFCVTDECNQRAAIAMFLSGLDAPEPKVIAVETALFRPKYLQDFDGEARPRMLRHLLLRLQSEMSLPALNLVDGIEEFLLDSDDLRGWLRAVVIACIAAPATTANDIRAYARRAYGRLSPEQKRIIVEKQEAVFLECEREGYLEISRMLRYLQESWSSGPSRSMEPRFAQSSPSSADAGFE